MTDIPVPFISISKENFAEFQRQVYDYAASICVGNTFLPHRHGLLAFVVTTVTWQQLPGVANINGIDFLARDVLNAPEPPADNANAWRLFEYRTKEFDKVVAAVLTLTRRLKDALPTADRNELSDPTLGMGRITPLEIMNHIRTQYGTLTSNDYKLLYAQLALKLDSANNFTGFAADQRFIFQQLESQGQPVPELQKCEYLRTGMAHLLPIQKAIDSYLTAHPLTATQTFVTLVEHITLHAPNFTPVAADMNYTAAATHTPSATVPDYTTFLSSPSFLTALATAAAAAALPNSNRQPRSPRLGRGGRRNRAPAATPTEAPTRSYCHAHGYDTHQSADCYKMKYGPTAHEYTNAARQATHHNSVPGGSQVRL